MDGTFGDEVRQDSLPRLVGAAELGVQLFLKPVS